MNILCMNSCMKLYEESSDEGFPAHDFSIWWTMPFDENLTLIIFPTSSVSKKHNNFFLKSQSE